MNLVLIWSVLLSSIILLYVLLDGFALGIGILFPWVPNKDSRDIMMSTVLPTWDGSQTWIVFGGSALYGAFPVACGLLLPALYMPIMIMLVALIFRGLAFEFRFKDEAHQTRWDIAFAAGSTIAALMQGVILGRFLQGYTAEMLARSQTYAWITPFSTLTGLTLVIAYALLGATWLVMRTEGVLQAKLFHVAQWLLLGTVFGLGLVCLGTLLLDSRITTRWIAYRSTLWVIPVLTICLAQQVFYRLRQKRDIAPFFLSVGLFVCSYIGFGVSLWPYVIPHVLTVWEAAAPASSLRFSLIGSMIIVPILLIYTGYTYYVFRGKVTKKLHY